MERLAYNFLAIIAFATTVFTLSQCASNPEIKPSDLVLDDPGVVPIFDSSLRDQLDACRDSLGATTNALSEANSIIKQLQDSLNLLREPQAETVYGDNELLEKINMLHGVVDSLNGEIAFRDTLLLNLKAQFDALVRRVAEMQAGYREDMLLLTEAINETNRAAETIRTIGLFNKRQKIEEAKGILRKVKGIYTQLNSKYENEFNSQIEQMNVRLLLIP